MKSNSAAAIAARKLALSAGKQHRAGMQKLLKRRKEIRNGVVPNLNKGLTALCKKERIGRADYEPLIRIIDLITPGKTNLSQSEVAREVRGIYTKLSRMKAVHPMVLAFAGIADDSISHAAEDAATTAAATNSSGALPRNKSGLTVAGEDLDGFLSGYDTGKKISGSVAGGIALGISGAYYASRWGLDWGLPII